MNDWHVPHEQIDFTKLREKMHRLILEKLQNTPIGVDPQLFEGEPCTTK
jgi:hypothetical protein